MNRRKMMDTVRYTQTRSYTCSVSLRSAARNSAYINGCKVKDKGLDSFLLTHKKTGLRAFFTGNRLNFVEVSLPRILFGHNGRLISRQSEIDAALAIRVTKTVTI